jgi:hypothetical protein
MLQMKEGYGWKRRKGEQMREVSYNIREERWQAQRVTSRSYSKWLGIMRQALGGRCSFLFSDHLTLLKRDEEE